MTEAEIRDWLTANLALLESGLKLVAKEYYLPNASGASGKVDIVARDRFGNFVIVELKKADATARTALHELYKYLTLFQSTKGIVSTKLRCILVSTHWNELLAPFSELTATSPFTIEGRKLVFESGMPSRAEQVRPLAKAEGLTFPSRFVWLTFSTLEDRQRTGRQLKEILPQIGIRAALFLEVRSLNPDGLHYPFGLILPFFQWTSDEAIAVLRQTHFRVPLLEDFGTEQEVLASPVAQLQEAVESSLVSKIVCMAGIQDVHTVTPVTFAAELASWQVDSTWRYGSGISDPLLFSDQDIVEALRGFSATNSTQFIQAVDPSHKAQYDFFVSRLSSFLARYGWWEEVDQWLSMVVTRSGTTIVAEAYCPENLLEHFAVFIRTGNPRWLPAFRITFLTPPWSAEVTGFLAWDGTTQPPCVDSVLPDLGGGNLLRLIADPDEETSAFLKGYGFVLPITSHTPDHPFVASCSFKSMVTWLSEHPAAAAELEKRLGPIVLPASMRE